MDNIIDAHSHFMPPEVAVHTAFFKEGWSDLNRLLDTMDHCGIKKSVLLYPTSDAHLHLGWAKLADVYNESMHRVVESNSERFIGAAIMPFADEKARDAQLKMFEQRNLRLISLASSYDGTYLDDEYFFPIFQFAQEKNIPVHVHPQIMNPIGEDRVKDPLLSPVLEYVFDVSVCIGKLMMEGSFLRFPHLKFIFAHYGGVLPLVKERFDNTYQMLRKREFVKDLSKLPGEYFKNLFFDTSGSRSVASLQCALEVTDASHVLYGSDFPANQNILESIRVVRKAGLTESEARMILENKLLEDLELRV